MTDNRERAVEAALPTTLQLNEARYANTVERVAAALDAAEARGRAEVAAEVEALCAAAVRRAMTPNTYVTVSALRALLGTPDGHATCPRCEQKARTA